MMQGAGHEVAGIIAITKIAALAYLMFNLYTPPCFAAIGAMNAEMKSSKWVWGGIALQFSVGYSISYLVYTIGTLLIAPETLNSIGALAGGLIVAIIIITISILIKRANQKVKAEYSFKQIAKAN